MNSQLASAEKSSDDATLQETIIIPKRSSVKSVLIVVACTGAMFLNVCASQAVTVAIPQIARDLSIASDKTQWLVSAFTLSSGCLLLLFGRIADLYGRKLVFISGSLVIVVFSLACSFSKTALQMLILRAMHGIGPAMMIPAGLGILAHSFPPSKQRSTAFATFAAGAPLGASLGFVFGAAVTQYVTWRAVFWFVGGLAALVAVIGYVSIDPDIRHPSVDRRIDWIGSALVTTALVFITFTLGEAPAVGWQTPYVITLLILGVLLLGVFLLWEHHLTVRTTYPPLLSLEIWTRAGGKFSAMQGVGFVVWCCFTSLTFWSMLYYQNYVGLDPIHTMIRFLPMPITGVLCNVIVAFTVGHIGGAYLLAFGALATSFSALLWATIKPSAIYWQYGFPAAVLAVCGADFVFSTGTLFIAKVTSPSEQSVAGALFQTLTSLGASFGLAITTIAQDVAMTKEAAKSGVTLLGNAAVKDIPPEALLRGYQIAQFAAFGFGMLGLLVTVVFLHDIGIVGDRREKGSTIEDIRVEEEEKSKAEIV